MRRDRRGVIAAVRTVGLKVPSWCASKAPTSSRARRSCAKSGLNVIPADDLDDAAQKIVKAVKGAA